MVVLDYCSVEGKGSAVLLVLKLRLNLNDVSIGTEMDQMLLCLAISFSRSVKNRRDYSSVDKSGF